MSWGGAIDWSVALAMRGPSPDHPLRQRTPDGDTAWLEDDGEKQAKATANAGSSLRSEWKEKETNGKKKKRMERKRNEWKEEK